VAAQEQEPAGSLPCAYDHGGLALAVATRFDREPRLAPAAAVALIDELRRLRDAPAAQFFVAPVHLGEVAGYADEVPVPIDLTTILCRVLFGYYRRLAAVRADVDLLLANCVAFNSEGSDIVAQARELNASLLNVLEAL
jgi:hypothetical protein